MSFNIKSAFIRPEFLLQCLICGKRRKINEAPFRRLGNESGSVIEIQLADLVKNYVGVVVNQALCCETCFLAVKVLENKSKLLKDKCKKAVKSVMFFVTSDADEDHNYYIRSVDKFVGSLISEDYENILPAEIIISNDNIHADSIQETDAIVHEGHMCLKCNASFSTIHFLRKHHKAEHDADKDLCQAEHVPDKDLRPAEHDADKDLCQAEHATDNDLRPADHIADKDLLVKHTADKDLLAEHDADKDLLVKHTADKDLLVEHAADKYLLAEHTADKDLLVEHAADKYLLAEHTADKDLVVEHDADKDLLAEHTEDKDLLVEHVADNDLLVEHTADNDLLVEHTADNDLLTDHTADNDLLVGHTADKDLLAEHDTDKDLLVEHTADKDLPQVEQAADKILLVEHHVDKDLRQAQDAADKDLVPEKNALNMERVRKKGHMSLRKNPRISVRSQFSDSSPTTCKKSSRHTPINPRRINSKFPAKKNKVSPSRAAADEKETPEGLHEDALSFLSLDKSLVEVLLNPHKLFNCSYCPAKFTSSLKCSAHTKLHKSSYWEPADSSPAKKSKIDDQSTGGPQCHRSDHQVDLSQAMSDEEDTPECVDEDVISVLSSDKKLVEALLKPQRLFYCSHCPAKFASTLECSAHKELHESSYWELIGLEKNPSVDNDKQYQCEMCGLEFNTDKESFLHMRKVHSGKNYGYKCKMCSKSFRTVTQLRGHLQRHFVNCRQVTKKKYYTNAKLFKAYTKNLICKICGKAFTFKSNLNLHKKIHSEERDILCDTCGRQFKYAYVLNLHKKSKSCSSINADDKDFLCDTCGRRFKHLRVLIRHRKRCAPLKSDEMAKEAGCESEVGRYRYSIQCKACSRTFRCRAFLIDHITIVHERECLGCGESVTSYATCRAHRKVCSIRNQTKSESVRSRIKALFSEDFNCEEEVAKSPVNIRETELEKLSENLAVRNTGDLQEHNYSAVRNTDVCYKPQIVKAIKSINSHFDVMETAGHNPEQNKEAETQPFPTESLTNEEMNLTESVKFQVDSNIFPTESVTDISSFINTSNIFHSFQLGDSGECMDPFQSEGQETLNGLLFTPDERFEYVQLEDGQILSSTELKSVTLVDPVLSTIEQDAAVAFLSPEMQ